LHVPDYKKERKKRGIFHAFSMLDEELCVEIIAHSLFFLFAGHKINNCQVLFIFNKT
jgi:hypothetical protein